MYIITIVVFSLPEIVEYKIL